MFLMINNYLMSIPYNFTVPTTDIIAKLYTVKQVAHVLGVSTNTIYKYLNEGKIKALRFGKRGRFRIYETELIN